MRLIWTKNFSQTDFNADQVPRYAILSHRWQQDELTFQDVEAGSFFKKKGFQKIKEACRIAERSGCNWLWIDTCCIDKRNAVELNEAINAMYKWYQQADICIAYLFDHTHKVNHISDSSWFERCWTLQELIAPRELNFYDSRWNYIGSKRTQCREIAIITGIPERILKGGDPKQCSVAQRMSWAANRKATRIEDEAYSLLGIFNLSMPTLYGTGSQAFQSLQEKLLQKHDQSILAWDRSPKGGSREYRGLLAESPADFASCSNTRSTESPIGSIMLVGDGVELDVDTIPYTMGVYLCALDCTSSSSDRRDAILLQQLDAPQHYARILTEPNSIISISKTRLEHSPTSKRRKLYVHHDLRHPPMKLVHGIRVRKINLLERYQSSHEKIRILSRLDGRVSVGDACSMVQFPYDEWGTTGVIYFPREQRNFRYWSVRWIKLGFDADFCPMVRVGFGKHATRDASWSTKHPPRYGTREYKDTWNNDWIYQKLRRETKTETIRKSGDQPNEKREREYTAEEYFNYRSFEQYKADPIEGVQFYERYLGLKVWLRLKNCPSSALQRLLSVSGSGPWKVWTLDIQEMRDFTHEVQTRHSLYTVTGAALLGALTYAHFKDKDQDSTKSHPTTS